MNNIEKRFIELREVGEDRTISGQAIVFNSESVDLGGWTEIILPEAIPQELVNNSDITMLYNHNDNAGVLARSNKGKGTLKIDIENDGVDFRFKAKNTNFGDEILSAVKEGDLSACSFAMRVAEDGDKWERRNGNILRTISKIELLDEFSIVRKPAYEQTSVRSFDEFKEKELAELKAFKDLKDKEEKEANDKIEAAELKKYIEDMKNDISKIK